MKRKIIAVASVSVALAPASAFGAPVYLDCVAFGKEFKGGQVHYTFTLNEDAQLASKTVTETGYTQARLVAAFSPGEVTVHEPGEFESNDFVIDRSSLKLKIITTSNNQPSDGGSGTCKVATTPKRKF